MYCIACGAQNSDTDKYCARCGRPLVSGAAAQVAAVAVAAPVAPTTAYRDGDKLVVPKGAPLPGYCVKCGEPVMGEFFRKKFQWHNPWLALIALVSPIIYIIVALIVMKRVELLVPMCEEHIQRRKSLLIATWVLGLGFIPAGILVGSLISDSDTAAAAGLWTGFAIMIAALVTGVRALIMRPKEITNDSATFTGASERFLAMLPSR
jgi:hypothetical protein